MSGKVKEKIFSLKNIPKIVKDVAAVITAIGVITGALITCSSFIGSKITESVDKKLDNISMDILSMGMSSDYYEAILEGANMVRIGSALFGNRIYK